MTEMESAKARLIRFLTNANKGDLEDFRTERHRLAQHEFDVHKAAATRWSVSLGVGNGAGLIALGSKLLDGKVDPWTYLFLPSAILFGLGVCAVGASHGVALWRSEHKVRVVEAQNGAIDAADLERWKEEKRGLTRGLWRVETAAEMIAAGCFAIGVLYPMGAIWWRLLTTGTISP